MRRSVLFALLAALVFSGCRQESNFGEVWQPAVSYSGYRGGQSPKTGVLPSRENVAEDLRILEKNWKLIRTYGADRHAEDVLEVIRDEKLDLKVMLGIWLDREPGFEAENAQQIAEGIRLANTYSDTIVAVNVGNEVLIEWTQHPVEEESVIAYVRQVRDAIEQPITVADNYVWWRDDGQALARELDFITMHSYPLWERRDIDEGLSYTVENFEQVRAAHPDKPIVIGEAGWATYTEGNLHMPRGGDEAKQARYYEELTEWARHNDVIVFFFEAFDEPWKGTGTEGYWGLFTEGRKAKTVMHALYPELVIDGPTSPEYPDVLTGTGPDISATLHTEFAAKIVDGNVNPLGPSVVESGNAEIDGADGGTALRMVVDGENWAGVYFMTGRYDAREDEAIELRLMLPESVEKFELKLEGPETVNDSVELFDYAGDEVDGWRTFTVPLSAFERVDLSQISVVGLWNPSDASGRFLPCELAVDGLRFR